MGWGRAATVQTWDTLPEKGAKGYPEFSRYKIMEIKADLLFLFLFFLPIISNMINLDPH